MSLVVDRYALGPLQTNCYAVRASRAAAEAAVIDPGGDAATLRLELARQRRRLRRDPVTHGHFDHLGGVADLAEGTGAEVWMPEGERDLLERYPEFAPARRARAAPIRPTTCSRAARRSSSPASPSSASPSPGHSPAHVAFHAGGCLFSGDLLFAGSVGRVDLPGADWDTLLASVRTLVERYPPETGRPPRPRPGDDARRRARPQPLPRGAPRA